MSDFSSKKICIVGSGLVGSLLAILLSRRGFQVDVYDKRKDPSLDQTGRGRSIALSLSERGWRALRAIGIAEEIKANTQPAIGRLVHLEDGTSHPQDYGTRDEAIFTVNRNFLNSALIKLASQEKNIKFNFEQIAEALNPDTGEISFHCNLSQNKYQQTYDLIIAADGVFSSIRKILEKQNLVKFESTVLEFGYKELCIPADAKGNHRLTANRVQVWPRKNSVYIAFPTNTGAFVGTLFLPLGGQDSLESITTGAELKFFIERQYPELLDLMPNLETEYFANPASTLTYVKGGPWHYGNKVLLIGDAAHAITPFYGMGMNIGFEDCLVLMDLFERFENNLEQILPSFTALRKPDADAMSELSLDNFKSINETPDPQYQIKWELERRLAKLMPDKFKPIYLQITYSDLPLRNVPQIKKRQEQIIEELLTNHPDILSLTDQTLTELALRYDPNQNNDGLLASFKLRSV